MKSRVGVIVAAAALLCPGAGAAVYKWRDTSGHWHFSDRKPAQGEVRDIENSLHKINIESAGSEEEKLKSVFAPETPAEKAYHQHRQQEREQQQRQQEQACREARRTLATIRGPVVFRQPDGSFKAVTEDERARREHQLAGLIEENCQ